MQEIYIKKSEVGIKGEKLACELIERKGWIILERNWRVGHYEVDIIATEFNSIHFVEVRTLMYPNLIEPYETIGFKKQRKLLRAASKYMAIKRESREAIFDIVSVVFNGDNYKIEFIENAFSPSWK